MRATDTPPRLYVDGHNLLHRAAFGFPARIASRSGRDITLVFGFFALIRACARSLDTPPEVIVVFDGHNGAADRRALLPHYKPPSPATTRSSPTCRASMTDSTCSASTGSKTTSGKPTT